MLLSLIFVPLLSAALAFGLFKNRRLRMCVLLATVLFHGLGVICFWIRPPQPAWNGFLSLDILGLLVLSIISILFLAVSFYLIDYIKDEDGQSTRRLISCLLILLAAMTAVTVSQHFGLLWIAVEVTTLFGVTLINFHRTPQGIEATWKCLLLCSVGIALALLGTLFLAVSAIHIKTLLLPDVVRHASMLDVSWFRLSVVFFLVGYGTKMGLAPMHSWKPDTYGEAPAPVGAILAGALTSCAFLAILRVAQVSYGAGQMPFLQSILVVLGFLSLFVCAIFVFSQSNFNRLLGYSSIEHMGILALGLGLGGQGIYGSLFHMFNNAMGKGVVFLVAANLFRLYKTRQINEIVGVLHEFPATGVLLLTGLLSLAGFPPFGTFFSELMILYAALAGQHYVIALWFAIGMAVIFIGMTRIILRMALGDPRRSWAQKPHEPLIMILPVVVLVVLTMWPGVFMPSFFNEALHKACALLGG